MAGGVGGAEGLKLHWGRKTAETRFMSNFGGWPVRRGVERLNPVQTTFNRCFEGVETGPDRVFRGRRTGTPTSQFQFRVPLSDYAFQIMILAISAPV